MQEKRHSIRVAAPGSTRAGDFWGGLAAMLVALPSSIAFGVLIYSPVGAQYAGQGALAGIIGAAVVGVVAPLLGRNGALISAPCAPAAAVLSALTASLAAGGEISPEAIFAFMGIAALASAVLQVTYGTLRLGLLIKYIPYQVVTGYMSGIALIIALGQLPRLLGLPKGVHLWEGAGHPSLWSWPSIVVGVVTIGAMAGAPRLTKKVPAAILGLGAGVIAYFGLSLVDPSLLHAADNPLIIGPITTSGSLVGVAAQRAASLLDLGISDIVAVGGTALTLSVLLSIDTLKTGVVLDALARKRHHSNREIVAQGLANTASFLTGGMPGAGTMGPTLVNFTSGGRTPLSGITAGVLAALAFLLFRGLVAWVPIATLAGILLVVAWRMFDRGIFRLLLVRTTRLDFLVIAAVIVTAETVGLITASGVGVALAILLFIRDQIQIPVLLGKRDLTAVRSKRRRLREEEEILTRHGAQGVLVQLQGNLFFGTTDRLFSELEQDLAKRRFILLDMRRVHSMDYTAVHLLGQMRERLEEVEGELLFSGMPSSAPSRRDIERYLTHHGLGDAATGVSVFGTRDGALEWMEERILEAAGWTHPLEERAMEPGEIEVLGTLDPQARQRAAGILEERSYPAGAAIFAQGEEGEEMFFVRRGRVHIHLPLKSGKKHHLATFCQGDFFGEMAFLDREPRSAAAEAATDVELFALTRPAFGELAVEDPALGAVLLERLAVGLSRRLRVADVELGTWEDR